ncbi:hypothetical protein Cgig2_033521 [Carnegiea gigantea]|uniref:Uncharacterized protein n=1 Tax=Carnegiea gigantea TaxID=171969 RepID=A0A9Q1GGU6_9CARY|nr:hypothetical protein Cgig2_033521 [Carnegiea gigantea]
MGFSTFYMQFIKFINDCYLEDKCKKRSRYFRFGMGKKKIESQFLTGVDDTQLKVVCNGVLLTAIDMDARLGRSAMNRLLKGMMNLVSGQAPSLFPRRKKPAISHRSENGNRPRVTQRRSWPLPHRKWGKREPNDRPLIDREAGAASQADGGSSPITQRPSTNFIKADPAAKLSLVQDLVKSWDLVTPRASDPPKVIEEEIAMVEVFARGVRAAAKCQRLEGLVTRYQQHWKKLRADLDGHEAEKKGLQRHLEEALAKAGANVAQAKEQGYQQGRTDTLGYLRKVLVTLAHEFQENSYFQAYLHYVDERQRAADEGRDLKEVEFISPFAEGEDAGDEATIALDAEAGASEEAEHEGSGEPDV